MPTLKLCRRKPLRPPVVTVQTTPSSQRAKRLGNFLFPSFWGVQINPFQTKTDRYQSRYLSVWGLLSINLTYSNFLLRYITSDAFFLTGSSPCMDPSAFGGFYSGSASGNIKQNRSENLIFSNFDIQKCFLTVRRCKDLHWHKRPVHRFLRMKHFYNTGLPLQSNTFHP